MCIFGRSKPKTPPPQPIAQPDNAEATRRAGMEARVRRMRAGAAANVLTSPDGIPSATTSTMGGVA